MLFKETISVIQLKDVLEEMHEPKTFVTKFKQLSLETIKLKCVDSILHKDLGGRLMFSTLDSHVLLYLGDCGRSLRKRQVLSHCELGRLDVGQKVSTFGWGKSNHRILLGTEEGEVVLANYYEMTILRRIQMFRSRVIEVQEYFSTDLLAWMEDTLLVLLGEGLFQVKIK